MNASGRVLNSEKRVKLAKVMNENPGAASMPCTEDRGMSTVRSRNHEQDQRAASFVATVACASCGGRRPLSEMTAPARLATQTVFAICRPLVLPVAISTIL